MRISLTQYLRTRALTCPDVQGLACTDATPDTVSALRRNISWTTTANASLLIYRHSQPFLQWEVSRRLGTVLRTRVLHSVNGV